MRILLLFVFSLLANGAIPWDFKELSKRPAVHEAVTQEPGVRALYFDSVAWKGKPTRVFAYYAAPAGNKLPAMVLIHGGGGTAFAEWVRMWNKRGYAAIAIDTCGNVPELAAKGKEWHPVKKHGEFGGPEGWGGFDQIDQPTTDQWSYHAVAAAVLAHSLLRSFPEVDARRIGVTGISWGGYLTDIVSGVDPRFRFAAPVYGCGFLGEDSAWLTNFAKMGKERAAKWLSLWDPSVYLGLGKMPMLWVTGTNDFAYPFPSLQKSYRLPRGPRTLAIRVRMKHSHPDGAIPEEIFAFADSFFKKATPLVRIAKSGDDWVEFGGKRRVVKAELNFTKDEGKWQERKWESVGASVRGRRASGVVPAGAKAWYLNLFDEAGLVVSGEDRTAR